MASGLSRLPFLLRGVGTAGLSVTEEEKEGRMTVDGTRDIMAARSLGTDEGSLCGLSRLLTDRCLLESLSGLVVPYTAAGLFHTFC